MSSPVFSLSTRQGFVGSGNLSFSRVDASRAGAKRQRGFRESFPTTTVCNKGDDECVRLFGRPYAGATSSWRKNEFTRYGRHTSYASPLSLAIFSRTL